MPADMQAASRELLYGLLDDGSAGVDLDDRDPDLDVYPSAARNGSLQFDRQVMLVQTQPTGFAGSYSAGTWSRHAMDYGDARDLGRARASVSPPATSLAFGC